MHACLLLGVIATVLLSTSLVTAKPLNTAAILRDVLPRQNPDEKLQATLDQLREAIKRLQAPTDEIESIIDSFDLETVADPAPEVRGWNSGPFKRTNSLRSRPYDTYGVAGRFGR